MTGANRGIGKETARQLLSRGITVLLGSRDFQRGVETARDFASERRPAIPIQIDVTEESSIELAAKRVRDEYGRLDVLVNNAGTFTATAAAAVNADDLRSMFEVNVFGAVAAIHAFLPLLGRSAAPRIVNISSTTASLTLTSSGADIPGDASRRLGYTSSKCALNMLTVQYAKAFGTDPRYAKVRINSASPGYTATDMNNFMGARHVSQAAAVIVKLATLPDDGPTGGFFDDEGPVPW